MKTTLYIVISAVMCGSIFAAEKSISMLLEEAQYQEETVGDVNSAMSIYEKILEDEAARRPEVAKAMYRYGLCLAKKGDNEKAVELFKQVVGKYSDQKIFAIKSQRELDKLGHKTGGNTAEPVVTATEPKNYATDVSPELDKISVTFSRPMKDKSWAWVRWNYPYPETVGNPSYDATLTTCSMGVKLEPGKAYFIRFNAKPYIGFYGQNGLASTPYALVFATKGADGKATPIPAEMLKAAKEINATKAQEPQLTQEMQNVIDANGTIYFKSPKRINNDGTEPIEEDGFINSDFVFITKMYDEKGNEIKFDTTHEGNHFRYRVQLNAPVEPGQSYTYYMEGYENGLIKPVDGMENVYKYYMRHSPSTGVPTLRLETYLLPEGAKLISKTPESIQVSDKNGRTKLKVEEVIPAGGSVITAFEYKLDKTNKATADPNKIANAIAAAKEWLELVDEGEYGKSWEEGAVLFKAAVKKADLEQSLATARKPLGAVKSRVLKSAPYTKSVPGAPDGEYVIIKFKTAFENKAEAIETVTPMLDKDGKWRVSGYYIN